MLLRLYAIIFRINLSRTYGNLTLNLNLRSKCSGKTERTDICRMPQRLSGGKLHIRETSLNHFWSENLILSVFGSEKWQALHKLIRFWRSWCDPADFTKVSDKFPVPLADLRIFRRYNDQPSGTAPSSKIRRRRQPDFSGHCSVTEMQRQLPWSRIPDCQRPIFCLLEMCWNVRLSSSDMWLRYDFARRRSVSVIAEFLVAKIDGNQIFRSIRESYLFIYLMNWQYTHA